MKKKLGRPRKKEGVFSDRSFHRASIVMLFYDEARKNGQKHSAAVAQTLEFIKQRYPMMRISETEVKRILAAWRPRGSHIIFRFERLTRSEQELVKPYWIDAQSAAVSQNQCTKLPAPADIIPSKTVMTYKMYLGERPNYPRHNRKPPKE